MSHVLVRNLDDSTLEQLKARARENGRSLQAELSEILKNAGTSNEEIRVKAERFAHRLRARRHTDSADFVAKDRQR